MKTTAATRDAGLQAPSNRVEAIYEDLIEMMISGELRPGDIIVERKIAERLDTSRTPVREALGRLESERLVYKQTGRGVTVSPFSTEALVEILNVRQLLEGEAAWQAAGEIPPLSIARIRSAQTQLRATPSPSPSEVWRADEVLHSTISEAAGNALMANIIRDLRRSTHVLNSFRTRARFTSDHGDTERLLAALETGDRDGARAAMQDHIQAIKVALVDRLAGRGRG